MCDISLICVHKHQVQALAVFSPDWSILELITWKGQTKWNCSHHISCQNCNLIWPQGSVFTFVLLLPTSILFCSIKVAETNLLKLIKHNHLWLLQSGNMKYCCCFLLRPEHFLLYAKTEYVCRLCGLWKLILCNAVQYNTMSFYDQINHSTKKNTQ